MNCGQVEHTIFFPFLLHFFPVFFPFFFRFRPLKMEKKWSEKMEKNRKTVFFQLGKYDIRKIRPHICCHINANIRSHIDARFGRLH